ncbi:MAG: STAS domain-containing protein [Spirochaetota bacterium]
MKISYRIKGNVQIFDIGGNITFEETAELESYILKNIHSECLTIAINLEKASYLTSSALGSFVRIHQTVKERDISIVMINLSKEIDNLFRITGITGYFAFAHSEEELR